MKPRSTLSVSLLAAASCLFFATAAHAVPSFVQESGNRLSDASPQSITGTYATTLRLYFIRDFVVHSATSTDGLAWSEETGVRVSSASVDFGGVDFSSATSASVLALDGGGFRMLLSVVNSTNTYSVVTATSANGLDWGLENDPITMPANTFAGSVRLLEEPDGDWRLFFTRAANTGFSSSTFRIFTASSTDEGLNWSVPVQVFDEEAHDVAPSALTDGNIRLYYTAPAANGTTATQILSAVETSALNFREESGARVSTGAASGVLFSPLAFRSSQSHAWRLYYAFQAATAGIDPVTSSAEASAPDPQRLSPPSIARTLPAATYTVSGEIFSTTVTARLTRSGETDINGTSLSRVDDQTFSVVFDTQGRSLGQWDLVVTNDGGQSATLASALTIDFEPGQVTPLDNVFRPAKGQTSRFDVTVFNEGHLRARLYTLEGRLVKTLFDGDAPQGTTQLPWDGRTDDGNVVASGVYFILFEGPKLDVKEKVVVIK